MLWGIERGSRGFALYRQHLGSGRIHLVQMARRGGGRVLYETPYAIALSPDGNRVARVLEDWILVTRIVPVEKKRSAVGKKSDGG